MERINFTHNEQAAAQIAACYDSPPMAYVRSFGCQQNVNDGEKIKGVLLDAGFGLCDAPEQADLILFNTCAVREHAEDRVFGNVGALKSLKEANPRLIIGVCGCMAQQPAVVEKLKKSYPFVDLVFGVNGIDTLPALLAEKLQRGRRLLQTPVERFDVVEQVPGCPSCTAATTSAPTASCPMCAGGSAAAAARTFWRNSASWWSRGIKRSPCWARM